MPSRAAASDIHRYSENLQDEIDSAALYRALAAREGNARLAEVYRRLAAVEERHAGTWTQKLKDSGVPVPALRPSPRTRALIWLARRFGTTLVLPSIASLEQVKSHAYRQGGDAESAALIADERSHARLLGEITRGVAGLEGGVLARLEGRHRGAGGNALRAAVLGASDGLLSNLSLVMGVAGADLPGRTVLITGVAGLLAGSFSMALGEWLSVQSSRELYQHQIRTEERELAQWPEEEAAELALIYQAKGLAEGQALRLAGQIMSDDKEALATLAREELGVAPEDLGGSAWEAALTSFLLFAAGAILPVLPFMFLTGSVAVAASLTISALGLFAIGAATTLFTGRTILAAGLRQVAFGLAAAAVTYAIGRALGVRVGA